MAAKKCGNVCVTYRNKEAPTTVNKRRVKELFCCLKSKGDTSFLSPINEPACVK